MSSEFRKTEDAAAVTDQLSDTEVEDDAFTTEQEEAMQQAGAKQEVTVDPPSSRTRARNTKKAASKKVAFAGSSGYSSNDSPALTKEFKDEQRLKRNLAKAKRQEEAGKTGDEWKIDPSDPSLRVGTEEWRMSKDKAGIAAYNSSRKNTMRLPGHGGINEIVNDPSSLVPSNGVVTIRAFEYHQLAVLLEVSTGDIWHFDLRHRHECLSSIFIMRLLMLSFLMQSMKEGQEGGTKLLDAVSKLAEQVPSESRQEMENLLVAARSQHNAAQNTLAHRNDVVAELCDIVNRLAVIWETTKQDLDGAKADMAKQEKAVASLRKKLLADIGQVRESVKRKASVTATADIEEMRDFRASFDRMVEDNSKMQQAAAAELQEVSDERLATFVIVPSPFRWPRWSGPTGRHTTSWLPSWTTSWTPALKRTGTREPRTREEGTCPIRPEPGLPSRLGPSRRDRRGYRRKQWAGNKSRRRSAHRRRFPHRRRCRGSRSRSGRLRSPTSPSASRVSPS